MRGAVHPTIRELLADRPVMSVSATAVAAARSANVAELLYEAAARHGATWHEDAEFHLAARGLRAEALQIRMNEALDLVADAHRRVGLPLRVFKGPAMAASVYESAAERPHGDIDIYVDADDPERLENLLIELGFASRSARAAVDLAVNGSPIHEMQAIVNSVAVDVHFTPFGLLTPLRFPEQIRNKFVPHLIGDETEANVPTPELALLIAAVNLARKGGGNLWTAGDIARLLSLPAGLNWAAFEQLARAEGLAQIVQPAICAVVEDLWLSPELVPFRVEKRPSWAPTLGEGDVHFGLRRRGTWVALRRPIAILPQSLRYVARWYVPSQAILDIRHPGSHGLPYPARLLSHVRHMLPVAAEKRRSARATAAS